MRGFVISVITLALIISGTAIYGKYWQKEAQKLYEAAAECIGTPSTEKAIMIKQSIKLVEDKRLFLHISLRKSKINALVDMLNAAYYYCREGNGEQMNRYLTEAVNELNEWREEEKLSFRNIL